MSQMVVTFRRQLARKKGRFLVAVPALLRQPGRFCRVILPLLCPPCPQHRFPLRGMLRAVKAFPIPLMAAIPVVLPPSGRHIIQFRHLWTNDRCLVYRFRGGIGRLHRLQMILGVPSDHRVWIQAQRNLPHPRSRTKLVGIRQSHMRHLGNPYHIFVDRINSKHILSHQHSLTNTPLHLHPQCHTHMVSASRLPHALTRPMAYSPPHLLHQPS
jgi:hypothetical protein